MDTLGLPYDYESIMHYGEKAGTYNGKETIITHDPAYQKKIGQIVGLTELVNFF